MTQARRGFNRWTCSLLSLLTVPFVLLPGFQGRRVLPGEIRAAHQAGIYLYPDELPIPRLPDVLNAAGDIEELRVRLQNRPLTEVEKRALNSWRGQDPNVEKLLRERADLVSLAERAALRPRCVFASDFQRVLYWPEQRQEPILQAVKLIRAKSLYLSRQGDGTAAVREQTLGFSLARHMTEEPQLLSASSAEVCECLALRGLSDLLSNVGASTRLSRTVAAVVRANCPTVTLRSKIIDVARITAAIDQNLRREAPGSAISRELERTVHVTPMDALWFRYQWGDWGLATTLQFTREAVAASYRPVDEQWPLQLRINTEAREELHRTRWLGKWFYGDLFVDFHRDAVADWLLLRAQERALIAATEVMAYADRNGVYPDRLEQATSRPPLDPFTREPLKYRREGAGFVIYSVGPKMSFNGTWKAAQSEPRQAWVKCG